MVSNSKLFIQMMVIVILAIIIALTQHYSVMLIHGLLAVHDWINDLFSYVFSSGSVGRVIQECLSFIALPFVVACAVALIYGVIKKSFLPCFMLIVWVLWLILVTALLMR